MEERIREAVKKALDKKKEIIIYPFGVYGKKVKEILNQEFHLQEYCIVDNNRTGEGIQQITDLDADKMNDYCYLVACINDVIFTEIIKSLDEKHVDNKNIEDVFWEEHYYHLYAPAFMIYDAHRQGITLAQYYENHYNAVGVKTDVLIDKIAEVVNLSGGGYLRDWPWFRKNFG
ncbi:MAG: hypothetical protein NC321_00320 [Clostridium sp.]|nr:hypothetical protein [Clostridium sp.]